jgi:hypothetical protein
MFCDEFWSRNLRSVNRSSLVSETIRDECVCVRLDSIPDSAGVVYWHKYPSIRLQSDQEGMRFSHRRADGAHSSNPAFSFENR